MDLITQKNRFDSPEFERQFHCDVPLGAFCSPEGTSFRLWAPTAEAVSLRLYDNGYLVAETALLARSNYGQPAVTSAPIVTNPDGSTIEPAISSTVGSDDPTASAIVQTTPAATNIQTASPDQDKGSTFVGIVIKFLLILLCVAIFCALIYGIIIMCSIFFYNNNKKKKKSQKTVSSHRDDNDPPSMMH